jgi:hypothetical protein
MPPSFASASNSLSASSAEGILKLGAPPRLANLGIAFNAAEAEPKRAIKAAKVTGPTFCVRASRSQSRFS